MPTHAKGKVNYLGATALRKPGSEEEAGSPHESKEQSISPRSTTNFAYESSVPQAVDVVAHPPSPPCIHTVTSPRFAATENVRSAASSVVSAADVPLPMAVGNDDSKGEERSFVYVGTDRNTNGIPDALQSRYSPSLANPPMATTWNPVAMGDLPYGWESAWSSEYNGTYYFNRSTGQRQWVPPFNSFGQDKAAFPSMPERFKVDRCSNCGTIFTEDSLFCRNCGAQRTEGLLPPGWEAGWDSKCNATFYFNRETNERSWDKPQVFTEPIPSGDISFRKQAIPSAGDRRPQKQELAESLEADSKETPLLSKPGPQAEACLVAQAACWIREANFGRHRADGRDNFRTTKQVEMYIWFRHFEPWFSYSNLAYLFFGFIEVPYWCEEQCPVGDNIPRLMTSNISSHYLMCFFEVCFLSVYIFRMWMNIIIFEHARHQVLHGIRWFKVACIAASLWSVFTSRPDSVIMLHKLLRVPIFISFTAGIRGSFVRVLKSLPSIGSACVMLLMLMVFFSWMGMVLFSYTPGGVAYTSLAMSMKHSYVLISTNNMPHIMLRELVEAPISGLFYVMFLVLALYLVMNVLLANLYSGYKELLEEATVDFYACRRRSVNMAYELLQEHEGGNEGIGQRTLETFLHELLHVQGTHADQVLQILDDDGSGKIECEEFRMVAEVLADPNFRVFSGDGGVEWLQDDWYKEKSEQLDNFCDVLAVVGAGIVMWQTSAFAHAGSLDVGVDVMCCQKSNANLALFVISMTYAAELGLEIPINGFHRFLASDPFQNCFDLVTVCALIPLELYFFIFGSLWAPSGACRMLALIRGFRVLRCVHKLTVLRDLIVKVYNGFEAFARVLILLFCVCYFAAQIGMMTMGGQIRKDNQVLFNSGYGENDFWALNFNDLPSALYLFWAHLVGNNANVWVDAFTKTFGDWVWFYFLAFDFVCNFVLLNIIVALVIDCVMVPTKPLEPGEEWEWPDREDQLREMFKSPELEELTSQQKEQREKLRGLFGAG